MRIGGLEAGGTKMVCAVGDENGNIEKKITVPTKHPQETMPQMIEFFKEHKIERLGIGCFGPIDLTKGVITTTPKVEWKNYPMVDTFHEALSIPVFIDTDVNAALLGEVIFGSAQGIGDCVYITVGTGIGIGVMTSGNLVHGKMHPEGGHMHIQRNSRDPMKCNCEYHESCLEGLAAGPAIEKRYGIKGSELPLEHEAWQLEADYIGQGIVNVIMLLFPKKIILGGGVMKQEQLYPLIYIRVNELLGSYLDIGNVKDYIVPPLLGDNQGVLGAMQLCIRGGKRYAIF